MERVACTRRTNSIRYPSSSGPREPLASSRTSWRVSSPQNSESRSSIPQPATALAKRLAATLKSLGAQGGSGIFARQVPLRGLSEALISAWTLLAVILRCEGARGSSAYELELALARHLGRRLCPEVERGLYAADDDETEALVEQIYARRSIE